MLENYNKTTVGASQLVFLFARSLNNVAVKKMTSQNDSNFNSAMGIKQNFNVAENTTYQDKVDDIKIVAKLTGSDFEYWIHKDKVLVGRNSSNGKVDVNIESSSYVSRNHFQINHERGRFFLMCLGKNGVFVNGQFQRLGASPLPLDKA